MQIAIRKMALLYVSSVVSALTCLWGGAWLIHIMPADAWYGFPLFISLILLFVASLVTMAVIDIESTGLWKKEKVILYQGESDADT